MVNLSIISVLKSLKKMIVDKDFTQIKDSTLMLSNNQNRKRFTKRTIKIKKKVNKINGKSKTWDWMTVKCQMMRIKIKTTA